MSRKIDHLGIAVEDLGSSIAIYEELGFELDVIEEVVDQRVRIGMLPCGDSRIELLESIDPDGPIARFIARRGPGVHHVAFAVDDIEKSLADLAAKGIRLIDTTPRLGAGGMRIAFIHPSATGGALIELCERR